MPAEVDIPRLRKGHVGGFFWSVFVECPEEMEDEDGEGDEEERFLVPSWRVR